MTQTCDEWNDLSKTASTCLLTAALITQFELYFSFIELQQDLSINLAQYT